MNDCSRVKFRVTVLSEKTGEVVFKEETQETDKVSDLVKNAVKVIEKQKPRFILNVYKNFVYWKGSAIEILLKRDTWSNYVYETVATEEGRVEIIIERLNFVKKDKAYVCAI